MGANARAGRGAGKQGGGGGGSDDNDLRSAPAAYPLVPGTSAVSLLARMTPRRSPLRAGTTLHKTGKSPLTGKERVNVSIDLNTDSDSSPDDLDDDAPPPPVSRSVNVSLTLTNSPVAPGSSTHHHAFVPTTHTSPRGGYTVVEHSGGEVAAATTAATAATTSHSHRSRDDSLALPSQSAVSHGAAATATRTSGYNAATARAGDEQPLPPLAPLDIYDGTGTRLSSAFERTLEPQATWSDPPCAADTAHLQARLEEQTRENAELIRRLETLESEAYVREESFETQRETAIGERSRREVAECALSEEKRRNSAYGQMAAGALDLKCVTEEDASALRREILEQEELVKGYQKENEVAMIDLSRAKQTAAATENQLQLELNRSNGEVARLRLDAKKIASGGMRYLERQLAAEADLGAVKRDAEAREAELRQERDAARAAAKSVEARLAGVDMSAVARDAGDIRLLDVKLSEVHREHGKETSELRRQIAWFTENQELVSERDAHLRRQAARIEELDRQLSGAHRDLLKVTPAAGGTSQRGRWVGGGAGEGTPRGNVGGGGGDDANKRRRDDRNTSSAGVAGLLGGNVSSSAAFDAGLAKKPNSVAALIRAARPKHEDSEKMIALEARCRRLQDDLDSKDGEHERSLRGLQQAHLRFKAAMEKRLKETESGIVGGPHGGGVKAKFAAPGTRQLERKVHELQGQVDTLTDRTAQAEKLSKSLRADRDRERERDRDGRLAEMRRSLESGKDNAAKAGSKGMKHRATLSGSSNAPAGGRGGGRFGRAGRGAGDTVSDPMQKSTIAGINATAATAGTTSEAAAAAAAVESEGEGVLSRNDMKERSQPGHPANTPFDPTAVISRITNNECNNAKINANTDADADADASSALHGQPAATAAILRVSWLGSKL